MVRCDLESLLVKPVTQLLELDQGKVEKRTVGTFMIVSMSPVLEEGSVRNF